MGHRGGELGLAGLCAEYGHAVGPAALELVALLLLLRW